MYTDENRCVECPAGMRMNTYFIVKVNNDINNTIKGLDSAVYAKYPTARYITILEFI